MSDEFKTLVRALKIPLLSEADGAALRELQNEWRHWREREQAILPPRIAEEQNEAFTAFVESPTPEREYQLMLLADANLTGVRYAILRRAFTALRGRISAQAAAILRPVLDRALAALSAEHARRRAEAEPVMSSRDRHPAVIEAQRAVECAESIGNRLLWASDGKSDKSPIELAGALVSNGSVLTMEAQS